MNKIISKYLYYFLVSLSTLVFIYISLRSFFMQVTHDEAYSFFLIHTNYIKALATTANTHWLNSLFMKIVDFLGGEEIWMLRIHNVCSFVLYAWFLIKISRQLNSISSVIMLTALFLVNPFTIEYFSLARGYAMSLTFLIGSFYFALRAMLQDEINAKYFLLSIFFGALSVFASYTALFHFVGIAFFLLGYMYWKKRNIRFVFQKKWLVFIAILLLTFVISTINLILIKTISDDLGYGGEHSFFTDTLHSILNNMLHKSNISPADTVKLPYFNAPSVILFISLTGILIHAIRKKNIVLLLFASLFFWNVVVCHIVFFAFNTPFPFGRTSLTLFPAIGLSVVFFIDQFTINNILKGTISGIFFSLLLFLFVRTANLNRSYVWPYQSEVKNAFDFVICEKPNVQEKIRVMGDNRMYSVWKNYYSIIEPEKFGTGILEVCDCFDYSDIDKLEANLKNFDFLIVSGKSYDSVVNRISKLKLLKHFEKSEVKVLGVVE